MKKYKFLIFLIIIVCVLFGTLVIYRYKIGNQILIWIDKRLDYERVIDVGEEFNKVVWGDFTFQINHYKSGNKLEYVKDEKNFTLLESVINYRIVGNRLFVSASEGCAVINENNIAKVYIESDFFSDVDNLIKLSSFSEFDAEEQKILERLK